MELINKDSPEVKMFYKQLNGLQEKLQQLKKEYKPLLNGERYLTDQEVSDKLKISRRTLQDYRTSGKLPYIHLGGKVLYRESDIERVLRNIYFI